MGGRAAAAAGDTSAADAELPVTDPTTADPTASVAESSEGVRGRVEAGRE